MKDNFNLKRYIVALSFWVVMIALFDSMVDYTSILTLLIIMIGVIVNSYCYALDKE